MMPFRQIALIALFPGAVSCWAASATIDIDASKPGPPINPAMYGIFLEEINHGVDGGLYAELIRNRGFEDAKPPEGFALKDGRWRDKGGYDAGFSRFGYFTNGLPFWSLVREGGAQGSMSLDMSDPLDPATPRSLRLQIDNVASGRLGIANQGFWGIGVAEGKEYNLSFWARGGGGFAGPLVAGIETADGAALAKPATFTGIDSHWKQFHATFRATGTDGRAKFVLTVGATGTLWLDMVSLFPAATFNNRANGLRSDIAQLIADLKPGFVRFPGGCVVEGGTIETAYNWRKTVGPLEKREEVWGPWNYRRTHGMGFYEYLQFCEDIGAEPLYVGFAGETCMFRSVEDVPMDQMGQVAENFVDALEFANGGADSVWGRVRASQGHPKPFGIKLVEVGNEGGTRNFPPRYEMVHSLLKSKYPDVSYINDLSFLRREWLKPGESDLEDNHFYNSPQWFMNNVHHYDNRDRTLPPVYDGEVAVTSGEGGRDKGNLIAALSEGAFLMGLERNADVVKMVSYAPLLANVHGRTDWHGMIYFDSLRAYGTASYHLWKLFGLNRPDCTLQTTVDYSPDKLPAIAGGIGVGTWNTAAEFKDIRVEAGGRVLYASDFSQGPKDWKTDGGQWTTADGAYRQSDEAVGLSYFGDESWSNYTITLKARKISGAEGFLIVFGHKNEDKYWWNVAGWGDREHGIEFNQTAVGPQRSGSVESGRWYDVKVALDGRRIQCYLDGELIHDQTAAGAAHFFALAGRDQKNNQVVLKAINVSDNPLNASVNLRGVGGVSRQADVATLSSERLSDNNSIERPGKVVPAVGKVSISGDKFTYQFPPNSCTVLRLSTQ